MLSDQGQRAGAEAPQPDRAAVLKSLDNVLASKRFQSSGRISDFLRDVVTESLDGRGGLLKAYSIATDVFGRRDFKDDSNDSIVRTSAHRLRQLLDEYYQNEGAEESWRILLPKGGYVPQFEQAHATNVIYIDPKGKGVGATSGERSHLTRHWLLYLAALVLALTVGGGVLAALRPWEGASEELSPHISVQATGSGAGTGSAASNFQAHVVSDLVSFGSAVIVNGEAPSSLPRNASHYGLNITVNGTSGALEAVWTLTDSANGAVVWTGREPLGPATPERLTRAANAIAGGILGQDGALLLTDGAKWNADDPRRCALDAQRRGNRITDDTQRTYECLERLVRERPNDALVWAQLSLTNYRMATGYPHSDADAARYFAGQRRALERAMELGPNNYYTKVARYADAHARGDHDTMDQIAAELLRTYPGYPSLRTTLAVRMAMSGRTTEARRLIAEKVAMGGALSPLDHATEALACYQERQFECARQHIDVIPEDMNAVATFLKIATYGQLGRQAEAARLWADMSRRHPGYERVVRMDLERQSLPSASVELLLEGARKGGVPIPS